MPALASHEGLATTCSKAAKRWLFVVRALRPQHCQNAFYNDFVHQKKFSATVTFYSVLVLRTLKQSKLFVKYARTLK